MKLWPHFFVYSMIPWEGIHPLNLVNESYAQNFQQYCYLSQFLRFAVTWLLTANNRFVSRIHPRRKSNIYPIFSQDIFLS